MSATALPGPIAPPARLLMGPGPISAYPSVLTAMSARWSVSTTPS